MWLLDGTESLKYEYCALQKTAKYKIMCTTTNGYCVIKFSSNIPDYLIKNYFIDIGTGIYHIIKHVSSHDVYICKYMTYNAFLGIIPDEVLKANTSDIMRSLTSKHITPRKI